MNFKHKHGKVVSLDSHGLLWPKFVAKHHNSLAMVLESSSPMFSAQGIESFPLYKVKVFVKFDLVQEKTLSGFWLKSFDT